MRLIRIPVSLVALIVAVNLSGCSAGGDVEPDDAPHSATQEHQEAPASQESLDDAAAATCTAFGDVLTILENADLGLDQGRMEAQEQEGWYQLATRVLERLPADSDHAVSRAIADLQTIAPGVPAGEGRGIAEVRSPEWSSALEDLSIACNDLDAPLTINSFTGG